MSETEYPDKRIVGTVVKLRMPGLTLPNLEKKIEEGKIREKILHTVEQREFLARCLAVNVCPDCGENLTTKNTRGVIYKQCDYCKERFFPPK